MAKRKPGKPRAFEVWVPDVGKASAKIIISTSASKARFEYYRNGNGGRYEDFDFYYSAMQSLRAPEYDGMLEEHANAKYQQEDGWSKRGYLIERHD